MTRVILAKRTAIAIALSAGLASCAKEPAPATKHAAEHAHAQANPPPAADPGGLDPVRLLVRASLDLRGVRPSEDELAKVEADPAAAVELARGFVDDPRFTTTVRAWFADALRTRIDHYPLTAEQLGLDAADDDALQASIAEEPLALVADIAAHDLPYTALVTADYTFANELLAKAFPVDYPPGAEGWQKAHYVDGRPAAGVLSMNSVYWRFPSNGVSYGRSRANALSRALLCDDFLTRPVDFPRDVDLSNDEAVAAAVRTNAACVSCHASLDPLAAHTFGFQYQAVSASEMKDYHEDREPLWATATGVGPAYFGSPSTTLVTLGQRIAADPRFVGCAVRRVYEGLLGRAATLDDDGALTAHREAFLAGGLTLKALARSVVADPAYAGRTVASRWGGTPRGVTRKLVGLEVLSSQIAELTGYRMTALGRDVLTVGDRGLRALAGGADGTTGAASKRGPTVPLLLTHERLAEAAAAWLFFPEGADPTQPAPSSDEPAGRLAAVLAGADLELAPGDPAFDAAARPVIVALHRAIFGAKVAPDGPEVAGALELLTDLHLADHHPKAAWAGLVSALLRDPELVTY